MDKEKGNSKDTSSSSMGDSDERGDQATQSEKSSGKDTVDTTAQGPEGGGDNNKMVQSPDNIIQNPTSKDILMGRGRPFQDHPGNIAMRRLVEKNKERYNQCHRDGRGEIAMQLLHQLTESGARFLKKGNTTSGGGDTATWLEATRSEAYEKMCHSLRAGRKKMAADKVKAASSATVSSPSLPSSELPDALPSTAALGNMGAMGNVNNAMDNAMMMKNMNSTIGNHNIMMNSMNGAMGNNGIMNGNILGNNNTMMNGATMGNLNTGVMNMGNFSGMEGLFAAQANNAAMQQTNMGQGAAMPDLGPLNQFSFNEIGNNLQALGMNFNGMSNNNNLLGNPNHGMNNNAMTNNNALLGGMYNNNNSFGGNTNTMNQQLQTSNPAANNGNGETDPSILAFNELLRRNAG